MHSLPVMHGDAQAIWCRPVSKYDKDQLIFIFFQISLIWVITYYLISAMLKLNQLAGNSRKTENKKTTKCHKQQLDCQKKECIRLL